MVGLVKAHNVSGVISCCRANKEYTGALFTGEVEDVLVSRVGAPVHQGLACSGSYYVCHYLLLCVGISGWEIYLSLIHI